MDDNRIEIVASLDIPKTVSTIKNDLEEVKKQLDASKALNIACSIDNESITKIQNQLNNLSKKLKLDIANVNIGTDSKVTTSNVMDNIASSADKADVAIKKVKKSIADLDEELLSQLQEFKPILFDNPEESNNGYINIEATKNALAELLKPLGEVSVVAKSIANDTPDELNRLEASIASGTGELKKLNLELDKTEEVFRLISSTYSDKGVGKIQQDIARLEKELANFKASHQAIETGLTQPLTEATNAINNLKNGVGSVENVQKALDNLKTEAAKIGTNLKSTGSSFNIFDNATNKAQNFDNTIKELAIDIGKLQFTDKKSNLVESLDLAKQKLEEFRQVEQESGKGVEWSQRYAEINSLLQSVTNNLKAAKKEESEIDAFNRKLDAHNQEIQKKLNLKEQEIQKAKELNEVEMQNYWQGRFEETIKAQTAENQVLKDMKKYYEELETEHQKAIREGNALSTLANRISKTSAAFEDWGNKNSKVVTSTKQMESSLSTFAEKYKELKTSLSELQNKEILTNEDINQFRHLNEEIATLKKEADAAGLTISAFFRNMRTQLSYVIMQWVSVQGAIRILRSLVSELTAVDTAMTELRKVTEATDEEFEKFGKSAGQTGRELGASVSDVINATAEFARLGESLPDAEELGRVATLYKNVGDGISIETASEDIVSAMKAFKIEAKDAISIVDKFNEVETCPFYILVERNRRQIFPNCWEILKSFSLLFSKRRKSETSKRIAYGEKKHIQSAKVGYVLSVV